MPNMPQPMPPPAQNNPSLAYLGGNINNFNNMYPYVRHGPSHYPIQQNNQRQPYN